jgi:hypothetical protein
MDRNRFLGLLILSATMISVFRIIGIASLAIVAHRRDRRDRRLQFLSAPAARD